MSVTVIKKLLSKLLWFFCAGILVVQITAADLVAQRNMPRCAVTGTITDEAGRPLSGVSVRVQGAEVGVRSDAKGFYSVPFSKSSQALWHGLLIVSFPGYETQQIRTLNHRNIDVKMVALNDKATVLLPLPAPQLKTDQAGIYSETCWDLDLLKYHYTRPADNPVPPGDVFNVRFGGSVASQQRPVISEYTLQAGEDRSINTFGKHFSVSGNQNSDTKVWIYRQTRSFDARLYQAALIAERPDYLVATIDAGEPYGMYLMWIENAGGVGFPVRINAPAATWIGPDHATAGSEVQIYGRNLSHGNGTSASYVYIRPWGADAATPSVPVRVTSVNPYKVRFKLPAEVEADSEYEVWVHNGHGGEYGWSGPLKLHIDPANPYVWNGVSVNVKNYGAVGDGVADDSRAIQAAIDAATDGGRIFFPAGKYKLVANGVESTKKLSFEGEGADKTIILTDSTFKETQMLYIKAFPSRVSRIAFKTLKPDRQGLRILVRADVPEGASRAKGLVVRDSRFETAAFGGNAMAVGYGINCIGIERVDDASVINNQFTTQVAVNAYACDGLVIRDNTMYGNWKVARGNGNLLMSFPANIKRADISSNFIQSVDNTGPIDDGDPVVVRAIVFQNWHGGRHDRLYIADNVIDRAGNPWDNSGEIILFELPTSKTVYSPSSVSGTTLMLPGKWRTNSLTQQTVAIVKNTGVGQYRRIIANDGGQIIIDRPWDVPPDQSSVLSLNSSADNAVIYNNSVNGIPNYFDQESATSGIQLYGSAFNNVIANNTFSNVHYGIYITGFAAHPTTKVGHSTGCMGTLVTGNTVTNAVYGLEAITVMYPEVMPDELPVEIPWSCNINTVFRDNRVSNITDFAVNGVRHGGYGILVGQIYNDWQDPHWNGPWVREALVEHNTVTDAASKYVWLRQHQQFTTVRKNNFVDTNKFPNTIGVYFSPESRNAVVLENTFSGNIDLAYGGSLPGPRMQLSQRSIEFRMGNRQDVLSKSVIIRNGGSGALDLNVSDDSPWIYSWLNISDVEHSDESAILTVRIDSASLSSGVHRGVITIVNGTDSSKREIGVKVIVQ